MVDLSQEPTFATSRDGTRIAMHRFGGEGPLLVVVHATGFHARCYLPLIPTLASRFTVVGVDLRGHGASLIDDDAEFVWDDFADDLLAVVDRLGGGPVVAFGHSMGAATVLLAESKRPGTFSRAWLYEPIIFPSEIGPRNGFMADNARKRRYEFGSRAEALHRYAGRPPLNVWRADALAAYVEHGFVDTGQDTVRLACRPVHEAMTFTGARIAVSAVADVTMPLVIARGQIGVGANAAAEHSDGTAAALAGATLKVYERIGHFGPFETPDVIAEDALAFLSASTT